MSILQRLKNHASDKPYLMQPFRLQPLIHVIAAPKGLLLYMTIIQAENYMAEKNLSDIRKN